MLDTVYRINRYLRIPHTYYVSAAGNDNNNGTYQNPKLTLAAASALALMDGDNVLFNGGDIWKGQQLAVPAGGAPGGRGITFGRYGTGNPIFDPTTRYTDFTLDSGAIWKRTHTSLWCYQVFEDGVRMKYEPDKASMVAGSWAFVSNVIYVWCSDGGNPNSGHIIDYGDGQSQSLPGGIAIRMNGMSNLIFDGIDVTKPNTAAFCTDVAGSNHIVIKNGTISWGGNRSIIIGCDPQNNNRAADHVIVSNMLGHDSLDLDFWFGYGYDNICQYCETYNSGKDVAPGTKNYPASGTMKHYPDGFMISKLALNTIMRGNYAHDIYIGHGLISELSLGERSTGTIIEKNNLDMTNGTANSALSIQSIGAIARNNRLVGGALNSVNCTLEFLNTPTGARVYHNTIYTPTNGIHSMLCLTGSDNVLKNNIFARGAAGHFMSVAAAAQTGFIADYNQFYGTGGDWRWGSTNYATIALFRTASSQEAHGAYGDPVFVTPYTDLHLQTTSPCKNAGVTGLGVADDYDSKVRDASPDIGAYEF